MYLLVRTIARAVVTSFFREITVLNLERVPLYGPVIFVGNHNNQFVDASMLLAMLPRSVSFLVADKSLKRPVIGHLAKAAGCIEVTRPQDKKFLGLGGICWTAGELQVHGVGTRFLLDLHAGDKVQVQVDDTLVVLTVAEVSSDSVFTVVEPLPPFTSQIAQTSSPSIVDKPIATTPTTSLEGQLPVTETAVTNKGDKKESDSNSTAPASPLNIQSLSPGWSNTDAVSNSLPQLDFFVIPRVDQSDVYAAVSECLIRGDTIGIFPEGGSHDRLELLPLKPGVAIMALSSALEGAEDVMIVPIGLNYYQAHKILSRAIVQVGSPFLVPEELVEMYKTDRRGAVSKLINSVAESLQACVVSAPDYTMLKAVRLCVTLYAPEYLFLPTDKYHMLYHQFSLLFAKHSHNPQVLEFTKHISHYSSLLKSYGIADHEVRQLKQTTEGATICFFEMIFALILALLIGVPLSILWGPLRMISSFMAENHRKQALAESKVKITGRDVVASYKILTMMVLIPAANFIYCTLFAMFYCRSLWGAAAVIAAGMITLPFLYIVSVRYFATIIPLLRKMKFLLLVIISKINSWRETEKEIITQRMEMQLMVRQLVDVFGPLTSESFKAQMERCVPEVVCSADSRRIKRRMETGDFIPIMGRSYLESREEIL